MYYPSIEEIKELSHNGNTIPVYREISADMETPVSAYLKVARGPYSFLLESVEGGERLARYSFIGTEPFKTIKTGPGQKLGEIDPLEIIEKTCGEFKKLNLPFGFKFELITTLNLSEFWYFFSNCSFSVWVIQKPQYFL